MNKVSPDKFDWITLSNYSTTQFKSLSDFGFIESCACNPQFDILRNDNKHNIYLPVKDKDEKLSIRSIDVSNDELTSDTFIMNVILLDGSDLLTCFGCDLSDNGILWLCIFNYNKILGVDLLKRTVSYQFDNVPCPNGICRSLIDSNLLYVCGGASIRNPFNSPDAKDDTIAVAPTIGVLYMLNIKDVSCKTIMSKGLDSQAGIVELKGKLFSSQLYDIVLKEGNHIKRIWDGTKVGDGGKCYLSDNLTIWDDRRFVSSIYRSIPTDSLIGLKNKQLALAGWSMGKLITSISNCMTCVPNNELDNAELLMSFSTQDVFTDTCFMIYDVVNKQPMHFQLDHSKLNIPANVSFDGHVTHVCHYHGKVIFINFKSCHILLIDDKQILLKLV